MRSYNSRFISARKARTRARKHAGRHAHVAATAKGARKRSRRRGCRTAGPPRVAECEYYGTEAITRDFPFAFFDSRLFFSHIPYYRREGGRGKREGQSLTPARASQPPRRFLAAFMRAHRCETDKEDEMDMRRRRRRRRLQPGFNETSRGPSNRFSEFSAFGHVVLSLSSRAED